VIVLDLAMPRMESYDFRAVQQADPSIADIPLVVFSSLRPDPLPSTAAFVRKSGDPRLLLDAIAVVSRSVAGAGWVLGRVSFNESRMIGRPPPSRCPRGSFLEPPCSGPRRCRRQVDPALPRSTTAIATTLRSGPMRSTSGRAAEVLVSEKMRLSSRYARANRDR